MARPRSERKGPLVDQQSQATDDSGVPRRRQGSENRFFGAVNQVHSNRIGTRLREPSVHMPQGVIPFPCPFPHMKAERSPMNPEFGSRSLLGGVGGVQGEKCSRRKGVSKLGLRLFLISNPKSDLSEPLMFQCAGNGNRQLYNCWEAR